MKTMWSIVKRDVRAYEYDDSETIGIFDSKDIALKFAKKEIERTYQEQKALYHGECPWTEPIFTKVKCGNQKFMYVYRIKYGGLSKEFSVAETTYYTDEDYKEE